MVLWKATEPTLALLDLFLQKGGIAAELDTFVLEKRKREWLCTRILLNHLSPDAQLRNLENGKPYLADGRHVSISHCDEIAGVIISDHLVGLDIQRPVEKLGRISSRFCSSSELTHAANSENALAYISLFWSALEAVF